MTVPFNGTTLSMADVIAKYGSAAAALPVARGDVARLQEDYDAICTQGNGLNSKAECDLARREIDELRQVADAMACHARAESSGGSKSAAKPPSDNGAGAPKGGSGTTGQGSGRDKGADGFLSFGSGGDGSGGKKPGAGGKDASGFLDFGDKGAGGGVSSKATGAGGASGDSGGSTAPASGNNSFPTPSCEFLSDASQRHDVNRYVCVDKEVYECVGSSRDPKKAWSRIVAGGCGSVRTIQAIEKERRDMKARASEKIFD